MNHAFTIERLTVGDIWTLTSPPVPNNVLIDIGHADFAIGDRSGQAFVCATKRDCDAIYAYFDALRLLAGPYLYQSAGGTVVVQLNSELDASTAGKVEQVVRGL